VLVCADMVLMSLQSTRTTVKTKQGGRWSAKPFHIVVNSISCALFPKKRMIKREWLMVVGPGTSRVNTDRCAHLQEPNQPLTGGAPYTRDTDLLPSNGKEKSESCDKS